MHSGHAIRRYLSVVRLVNLQVRMRSNSSGSRDVAAHCLSLVSYIASANSDGFGATVDSQARLSVRCSPW